MKPLAFLLAAVFVLAACRSEVPPAEAAPPAMPATASGDAVAPDAPYRFDRPVASFTLPAELKEISGLTVLDEGHLGAVQDEDGQLYVLDVQTGEVTAVVPFGGPGDYEGVELADGRLFVLRSDGVIIELEGWEGGTSRARTYALDLPTECDAEGLGYDPTKGDLLIACKDEGGVALGNRKALFALHLDDWSLNQTPAYVLEPRAIDGDGDFKPSGLAVHPLTGQVTVLSSKLGLLVALDADGTLAHPWDFSAAGMEQPEGIAYLPGGDLVLASEGDDGPPVLQRFAYQAR